MVQYILHRTCDEVNGFYWFVGIETRASKTFCRIFVHVCVQRFIFKPIFTQFLEIESQQERLYFYDGEILGPISTTTNLSEEVSNFFHAPVWLKNSFSLDGDLSNVLERVERNDHVKFGHRVMKRVTYLLRRICGSSSFLSS